MVHMQWSEKFATPKRVENVEKTWCVGDRYDEWWPGARLSVFARVLDM